MDQVVRDRLVVKVRKTPTIASLARSRKGFATTVEVAWNQKKRREVPQGSLEDTICAFAGPLARVLLEGIFNSFTTLAITGTVICNVEGEDVFMEADLHPFDEESLDAMRRKLDRCIWLAPGLQSTWKTLSINVTLECKLDS